MVCKDGGNVFWTPSCGSWAVFLTKLCTLGKKVDLHFNHDDCILYLLGQKKGWGLYHCDRLANSTEEDCYWLACCQNSVANLNLSLQSLKLSSQQEVRHVAGSLFLITPSAKRGRRNSPDLDLDVCLELA